MSILNRWLKTSVTPIALGLSLIVCTSAIAHKNHHQRHDGIRHVLSQLSLTDTQKQDIKQIMQDSRADRDLFKSDFENLRSETRELIQSDEWDAETANSLILLHQTKRQAHALQRATNLSQVWTLLNDEQQAQFDLQMENRRAQKLERRSNKTGKNRQFKKLDLSQEQKTAIDSIKTSAEASVAAYKERLVTYKQAEQALIQSSTFDAAQWQTLSDEYQNDKLAMALNKLKTKHDLWQILTPEQQSLVADKQRKRMKKSKTRDWG